MAEFARARGDAQLASRLFLESAKEIGDHRLARSATESSFNAHNYPEATEASELWLQLDPDSESPHRSLALLMIHN
ncbi:MAG: hypothetical protein HQL48_07570, partial [Gammaproteobacteria bacterium]|nr:hypothetical protein [Gammaproteobacteria bacterium]